MLKLIRGMLRTDKVYAQIDEATHGTSGGSVALTASQTALLTSMGVDLSRIQSVDAKNVTDPEVRREKCCKARPIVRPRSCRSPPLWAP